MAGPGATPGPARWAFWIRLFDHLSFRVKFLVIGVLLATPLVVATTWAAVVALEFGRRAELRAQSVEDMRQIAQLLGSVGQHRGLSARVLAGEEATSGELVRLQPALIVQARAVDVLLGDRPDLAAFDPGRGAPIAEEMSQLTRLPHSDEPQRNFDRHNTVAERLLVISNRLQTQVSSELGADKIAEAHALVAVFGTLPLLAERVGRQRGFGSSVLGLQTYSAIELTRFGLYAGTARHTLSQFAADRTTVATLDAYLRSVGSNASMSAALGEAEVFVERSLATVLAFTRDDGAAAQHFSEGTQAIRSLNAVAHALSDRLTASAHQQRQAATAQARWALIGLVATVLLLSVLYVGFERSTVIRLRRLKDASVALSDGRFEDHIRVHGSDEIAFLGQAMDDMRQRLIAAIEAHAQALAQHRAQQAREDFLARWSHDLRTPLHAILGYAQLMQQETALLRPAQQEFLSGIHGAATHLLRLVDDVLEVATRTRNDADLRPGSISLVKTVEQAIVLMQPSIQAQGGVISFAPAPGDWNAWADPTRALQILTNLLSNALKFNRPQGRITVTLAAAEDGLLAVSVRDEGRGLDAASISRLFRPLERLDAADRGIAGTGLGLSIARQLSESLGGSLQVSSSPGQGACFTWTVPVADDTHPRPIEAVGEPSETVWKDTTPGETVPAAPQPQRHARLVLVEDDEVNINVLRAMLAGMPEIRLTVFTHCDQALADASAAAADLWLIDRHVGHDDGIELLLRLRERNAQVRAVLFSADATEATRRKALEAGFLDVWTKPLALAEFRGGIRQLLQLSPEDSER
ncbi:MAG: response regulator [Rubrivivax sp.]|nr:response regulator [Rubrivivax sp.]